MARFSLISSVHKLESIFCQVEGEVRTVMFVTIDGRGCLKLEQMIVFFHWNWGGGGLSLTLTH
jgi:hypothetical protein